jgi:hypothetical protein
VPTAQRLATLRAALGFLKFPPRPEVRLLHRWLDTWTGLALVVGVERQRLRFSLSHMAEGGWRANFIGNPMFASGSSAWVRGATGIP